MKAYFFDLDGTLTDSRIGLARSFRAALDVLDIPAVSDRALDRYLGTPLPEVFRAERPGIAEQDIERGIRAFRQVYECEGIYENHLYPGVREMLRAVRDLKCTAWTVTSKPHIYAERVIDILDIREFMDGVIGAGLDETDTKTTLIGRALAAAGTGASRATMLGDRHHDMIGARENGVEAIGALWGYGSRKELEDAGCRVFVRSPAEFTKLFVGTLGPRKDPASSQAARTVARG